MRFETERLILRPWDAGDAESCYEYARDPRIGPDAGWPVHRSVENSREIIENVLAVPENYAVCLKEDNRAIGAVGIKIGILSDLLLPGDEGELGCWLGAPFWGRGLIPEALGRLMEHAFCDLELKKLWYVYFDGNAKSKRVQEKLGFQYQYTVKDKECPLIQAVMTEHVNSITKEQAGY